jgi:hypothetical protein
VYGVGGLKFVKSKWMDCGVDLAASKMRVAGRANLCGQDHRGSGRLERISCCEWVA